MENNKDNQQNEDEPFETLEGLGDVSSDSDSDMYDDDDGSGHSEEEWTPEQEAMHQGQLKQTTQIRNYLREKNDDWEVPKTVTILDGPTGEKIYLVGTAHFSTESCEDVAKVISMVQPDAVVIELCSSRIQVLSMDEDQLANMSDGGKMERLRKCVQQKGFLSGLVLYMMLQMSSHITKQLDMAPGSEFRTALKEMKKVPGCRLYLGDRPIEITLQRMLSALSIWQKLRFGLMMLQELKPISPEEVEKMKERDIFEQLLDEMVEEFPHVAKALVNERDIYLTGYLQKLMKMPVVLPNDEAQPPVIVGVVGIGHTTGIKAHFDKEITDDQMKEICIIPPPSRVKQFGKYFFKGSLVAATIYFLYSVACWTGIHERLTFWTPVK